VEGAPQGEGAGAVSLGGGDAQDSGCPADSGGGPAAELVKTAESLTSAPFSVTGKTLCIQKSEAHVATVTKKQDLDPNGSNSFNHKFC
jgi:hypothetical protein